MPAYNAQQTIRHAVLSTLRQLPRDSELVVLDDASSDSTFMELARMSETDSRLVVRRQPQNLGAAATLRQLLRETDSEFVARMDADDIVLPGRFRLQMEAASVGADITFMTVAHYWPRGKKPFPVIAPSIPLGITARAMPFHLLLVNPVAHSTMLARRTAIEALGGYRSVPAEDYDLWLRAAIGQVPMVRMATPGIAYRHHANQITALPEWVNAAATNSETRLMHESLTRSITGSHHPVFKYLRTSSTTVEARETLEDFQTAILDSSRRLPFRERFGLQRALRGLSKRIARCDRIETATATRSSSSGEERE